MMIGVMPDSQRPNDVLARAVELLEAGAWQQAHEIVQKDESELAAWLHGIVHTLEGDLDNARYWYRRAERAFPGRDAVQEEIAAAQRRLQGLKEP
jgi:glycine cleavage system aminomethyltransferase T